MSGIDDSSALTASFLSRDLADILASKGITDTSISTALSRTGQPLSGPVIDLLIRDTAVAFSNLNITLDKWQDKSTIQSKLECLEAAAMELSEKAVKSCHRLKDIIDDLLEACSEHPDHSGVVDWVNEVYGDCPNITVRGNRKEVSRMWEKCDTMIGRKRIEEVTGSECVCLLALLEMKYETAIAYREVGTQVASVLAQDVDNSRATQASNAQSK